MNENQRSQQLRMAMEHHRRGMLAEAEEIYDRALEFDAANVDALHLLGVLHSQSGRLVSGERLIRRAIELKSDVADFYGNLGSALLAQGRLEDSAASFQRAVELRPAYVDALFGLGTTARRQGRLEQAEQYFRRAIQVSPNHVESCNSLGVVLDQAGKAADAIEYLNRAIEIQPRHADAHNNLGNIFNRQGKYDAAVAHLRAAIEFRPDFAEAHSNLGIALLKQGRNEEAVESFGRAIEANPSYARAVCNMGSALAELGRGDEAISYYRKAAEIDPSNPEFRSNLGVALGLQGDLGEAIRECRQTLEMCPANPIVWHNYGFMLHSQGCTAEAVGCYRQSMYLDPDEPKTHLNLGVALLRLGDFRHGWPEYEWRFRVPEFVAKHQVKVPGPQWQGEDIRGRTVLVQFEQGMGDLLQSVRFIRLLADRCESVLVASHPSLKTLLSRVPGVARVYAEGEATAPFHTHVYAMSLAGLFQATADTVGSLVPYLTADRALADVWAARLAGPRGELKVGLVWAGNASYSNDRARSIALSTYAPLAGVKGVTFYSLQKGPSARQADNPPPGMKLVDLSAELSDFSQTAAIIANLDIVITVDTAVGHLAGAMGKPVWVLLPYSADWRWLLHRTDSPWYPSMRLFRQTHPGAWEPVLHEVTRQLDSTNGVPR